MKNNRIIYSLFLALGIVIGCQNTPSTPNAPTPDQAPTSPDKVLPVFANYYIRYIEDDRLLRAEASFKEGENASKSQPITFKGGVAFMSSGMQAKKLNEQLIRYEYLQKVDFPKDEFRFNFKDKKEQEHLFNIGLTPIVDFEVKKASISSGLRIDLKTEPLTSDETLIAILTDTNGNPTTIEQKGPTETSIIQFSLQPHQSSLSPGKATISLIRKKTKRSKKDNYNHSATAEYYSKPKNLSIIP